MIKPYDHRSDAEVNPTGYVLEKFMSDAWRSECERQDQELISQLRLDIQRLKNENTRLVSILQHAEKMIADDRKQLDAILKDTERWMRDCMTEGFV